MKILKEIRNLIPKIIGKLYNEQKTTQGGDKKSKGQNDPLINTAKKISEEQVDKMTT